MALADFPTSYKDPQYAALDAATEQKLNLPAGMVQAVRTDGERTNADRVSSAGARTPYQFTPTTRRLVLDKYGVDPYLSPATASEATGLLLKEGLDRNQGDPEAAVREFHGGTNRDNWGKQNDAYWARVGPALDTHKVDALSEKFAQWNKANPPAPATPAPTPGADPVGQKLLDRFSQWKSGGDQIPDMPVPADRLPVSPSMPQPVAAPEPSLVDKAIGTGEAALTLGTGLTGGTIGMAGGLVAGLAEQILNGNFGTPEAARMVEQTAMAGANALTYQPRTKSGQDQAGVVGDAMQQMIPVAAVLHTMPPVMDAARPVAGMARDGAASVMDRAATAMPQAARDVAAKITGVFKQGQEAAPVDPAAPAAVPAAVTPLPPEQIAGLARKAAGGSDAATKVLAEQARTRCSCAKELNLISLHCLARILIAHLWAAVKLVCLVQLLVWLKGILLG